MGTPVFAVCTLRRLVESGYNVVAVVTQRDKPVGRHALLTAPPVKEYAMSKGIPVLQPTKLRDEAFLAELRSYAADVQVVVAFRMLPEVVWSMPRYGTFNVHASLLPNYRGAAPINWAIINGETVSGVTTFLLDRTIDTGAIIAQRRCAVPDDCDAEWLYNRLMVLGAELATETIDMFINNNGVVAIPQDNSQPSTPAPKLFKENTGIPWEKSAKEVYNFVRGLSPTPCAWALLDLTATGILTEVKIYSCRPTDERCSETPGTVMIDRKRLLVACGDCWLELLDVQLAGKRRMAARQVINGLRR